MIPTRAPTDDRQSLLHRYRWQLDALRCGLADSMHELREAVRAGASYVVVGRAIAEAADPGAAARGIGEELAG